jgi:hypothetical protein
MKSGDRVATGTGDARRPLTLAEAEAGGLPERMTKDEWAAMHRASAGTEAERGAAVDHAEKVVLTAAVAYAETWDDGFRWAEIVRRQDMLLSAVTALKAAEMAS